MAITIPRPAPNLYAPSHGGYVGEVPDGRDLFALLEQQAGETAALLRGVSEERSHFRYAPGKWSIREVIAHINDAERVFGYRALRFARGDATPLPPFDENAWAAASNAEERTLAEHVAEFQALRSATAAMFRGFRPDWFARTGTASGHTVSVGALLYVTIGHERHHVRILRERYGI